MVNSRQCCNCPLCRAVRKNQSSRRTPLLSVSRPAPYQDLISRWWTTSQNASPPHSLASVWSGRSGAVRPPQRHRSRPAAVQVSPTIRVRRLQWHRLDYRGAARKTEPHVGKNNGSGDFCALHRARVRVLNKAATAEDALAWETLQRMGHRYFGHAWTLNSSLS